MKYLNFRSRAEFYRTDLTPTFFDQQMHNVVWQEDSWSLIKPLILHKDCPERHKKFYTMHNLWYIRLTAMLNKNSWRTYLIQAMNDKKSTVRAAAYRRAIENIPTDQSIISAKDLVDRMVKDKGTQNYFNMSDIHEYLRPFIKV